MPGPGFRRKLPLKLLTDPRGDSRWIPGAPGGGGEGGRQGGGYPGVSAEPVAGGVGGGKAGLGGSGLKALA